MSRFLFVKNTLLIFFFLLCFGCSKVPNEATRFNETTYLDGDRVVVNPKAYEGAFQNPLKGFRDFFSPGVDVKRATYPLPFGSMVKEYMQWNKLESSESDGVDKIISYSNHRWQGVEAMNVKVIPRVFLEWPEEDGVQDPNIPDDIRGRHWPADMQDGDYSSSQFKDRVRKLVKKLGAAWDNDPRVAYIEMGIIGQWGEQHTPHLSNYWPPHDGGPHVAGQTWLPGMDTVLGNAFKAAFKNKKVLVRYAYDFKDYSFGIIWDSWAMPEEQQRGYEEMLKLGDRWKTQPIGGEFTWNWGVFGDKYSKVEDIINNDAERARIIEMIRNLHCNHLGGVTWADFSDPVFFANASLLQKAMGYRFEIKEFSYPLQVKQGSSFALYFSVVNTGSGPFYYNWPVEISLLHKETKEAVWKTSLSNVDITTWMPGGQWDITKGEYIVKPAEAKVAANLNIPATVSDGEYIVAIAILDPGGNLPAARFAVQNYFSGGRHPMGYIGVNKKPANPAIEENRFNDIGADKTLYYSK